MSHLTRGAWIEIAGKVVNVAEGLESHLTRGAWIEIVRLSAILRDRSLSHLTRGAWIEITKNALIFKLCVCRTSHEVRGLKFLLWL